MADSLQIVDDGRVYLTPSFLQTVKVGKDKDGIVARKVLAQTWADWIDHRSVDLDCQTKREIICVKKPPAGPGACADLEPAQRVSDEYKEVPTGDYVFGDEWPFFRIKTDRSPEVTSVADQCEPGRRKIAVKVVDIFSNHTMTTIEVRV